MQSNHEKTQEILATLRTAYLEELPSVVNKLEDLILVLKGSYGEATYHELVRLVHNIKGNGGTMGFQILSTICHRYEDYLTQIDLSEADNEQSINTCFRYVDLLRLANDKLYSKQSNFEDIAAELELIFLENNNEVKRALIVEPSKSMLKLMVNILSGVGFDVAVESSGYIALGRLLNEPFDLVVTANEMPGLNGQSLAAAVRLSKSINHNIKYIMVSSRSKKFVNRASDPDKIVNRSQNIIDDFSNALDELINQK